MSKHSFVFIEIPAIDREKSGAFYSDLFGWEIKIKQPYDYYFFKPDPGPDGGFVKAEEHSQYKPGEVLVYISTDDIDATLAKVESLGGKTLVPKTEIPGTGCYALFSDPTGNRIGLFSGVLWS